ncbi:hypothetical protein [Roseateles puraquae]|uniref:hypothetical protein n=1 Tax=Roseateles puraquae TaxID=431059 RepID=UPI0031D2B5BA
MPKTAEKYILRFEKPGHRAALKALAAQQRRSLNQQLLLLIEEGQRALAKKGVKQ